MDVDFYGRTIVLGARSLNPEGNNGVVFIMDYKDKASVVDIRTLLPPEARLPPYFSSAAVTDGYAAVSYEGVCEFFTFF